MNLKSTVSTAKLKKTNAIKPANRLKFIRDLESDWTIKNDIPHFGLKEHAAVDSRHGFVLATTLTPASVHYTNFLFYCTAFSRHTKQKIKNVYADKGYLPCY
jgi:hypothetical protein